MNQDDKDTKPLPVITKGLSWKTRAADWPTHLPPLLFSACIFLLIEVPAIVVHKKAGHLSLLNLCLLGIATGATTLLAEHVLRERHARKRFQPVAPLANALVSLFDRLQDSPLEAYVKEGLDHRVKTLINFLDGNQLEFTYSEQIEIANSLAKDTEKKLWAISTDEPSVLWREGSNTYFHTLKSLNPSCEKKRLVLLKFDRLLDDYERSFRDFIDFVNWHNENNFELHFRFVEPDSTAEAYVAKNLVETPEGRLTDFLIRDNDCVYGRIRAVTGNRVVLRFITAPVAKDTLKHYEDLFQSGWNDSKSADRVRRLLSIASQKRRVLVEHNASTEERRKSLATTFSGLESGVKFFEEVCKRIENAHSEVRAVDIAWSKGCLDQWGSRSEYHGFLSASIAAAKAGKTVRRLYVVATVSDLTSHPLVKENLRKQLEAKIEVAILEEAVATTQCIHTDDYILVDRHFGFYLGEEHFEKDLLEFGKNTLSKSHIDTFADIFDTLFQSQMVKQLSLTDINL